MTDVCMVTISGPSVDDRTLLKGKVRRGMEGTAEDEEGLRKEKVREGGPGGTYEQECGG